MDNKNLFMELLNITSLKNIKCGEEMRHHTTLKVGGKADLFIEPTNEEELKKVIQLLIKYNIKYYIIGRGSNVLVKDEGITGAVIKISDKFKGIEKNGTILTIKAGTPVAEVAKYAYKYELTGFEFASGIPGTIGGAVVMNAGAYGGEMKDVIKLVKLIDDKGNIQTFTLEDMAFSYRKSIITEKSEYVVLSVELQLENGNKKDIFNEMNIRAQKRSSSQPLEKCNCGSTFKRPYGYFAGQLIEECGLKGYTYKGVEVSSKHAGFIVNNGQSTATDMLTVINYVKKEVYNKFGVQLEEEVKIL